MVSRLLRSQLRVLARLLLVLWTMNPLPAAPWPLRVERSNRSIIVGIRRKQKILREGMRKGHGWQGSWKHEGKLLTEERRTEGGDREIQDSGEEKKNKMQLHICVKMM